MHLCFVLNATTVVTDAKKQAQIGQLVKQRDGLKRGIDLLKKCVSDYQELRSVLENKRRENRQQKRKVDN